MPWLHSAVEEVIRSRAAKDEVILSELQRLRVDLAKMRTEQRDDRFWNHIGVEGTLMALGIAFSSLPNATTLGTLEGLGMLVVGTAALIVTAFRQGPWRER
jgi:hypothetical protein